MSTDVRKTVTALFCDVSGSTELGERLDPEALRGVMERYFAAVAAVVQRHGGTVEKFVGDAVMAAFGVPTAHEDDALRACRAAVEIFSAVLDVDAAVSQRYGATFSVRIGIETGEVLVGDLSRGSTFAAGPAVNLAARLEQAAGPGECLVGPDCYRLVSDFVEAQPREHLLLKGIDSAVDAVRLVTVRDVSSVSRRLVGRLVGRTNELGLLRQAFDRAAGERTCQMATVLGVAGMGKTRLADELTTLLSSEALVLRGRCLSYGEGVTWWPLLEIVRQAAMLSGAETEHEARERLRALLAPAPDSDEVVALIAPVAGIGGNPGRPEDTSWAVRRLLVELARKRPLVLVVDDLHWAEAGFLAVAEDVVDWLRDVPVLVLVFARPEFLDDYPSWARGRPNAVTVALEPLSDDEVATLTDDLFPGTLPDGVTRRLHATAGGNPLYVEQLLAMLSEGGLLGGGREGGWAAGRIETLPTPPSVAALILARLDRLPSEELALLGVASVMGQVFYRSALGELATTAALLAVTSSLVRKGLVRPASTDIPGQDSLAFSHVLVREAAYARLPKSVRADLHERFARWLDKSTEGRSYDDLVGAHLEAAYLSRTELGAPDDQARALGLEASRRLETAGRKLLGVDDLAAASLLERADRLRDDSSAERWELRLELARISLERQPDSGRMTDMLTEVDGAATDAGQVSIALRARLLLAMQCQNTAPEGATEMMRELAEEALGYFSETSDHLGRLRAFEALVAVANMRYDNRGLLAYGESAAQAAELAGRPLEAEELRGAQVWWRIFGDTPASEGLAVEQELLSRAQHRTGRLQGLIGVGHFSGLLGHSRTSTRAWRSVDSLAEELGSSFQSLVHFALGRFAMATCSWEAAVDRLTQSSQQTEAIGNVSVTSTELACLAVALLNVGSPDEALQAVMRAEQLGSTDDMATTALCTIARAWLAALDKDADKARAKFHEVLSLLPDDLLGDHTLARLAAIESELLLGDLQAARDHGLAALDLCRRKENLVATRYVEDLMLHRIR